MSLIALACLSTYESESSSLGTRPDRDDTPGVVPPGQWQRAKSNGTRKLSRAGPVRVRVVSPVARRPHSSGQRQSDRDSLNAILPYLVAPRTTSEHISQGLLASSRSVTQTVKVVPTEI